MNDPKSDPRLAESQLEALVSATETLPAISRALEAVPEAIASAAKAAEKAGAEAEAARISAERVGEQQRADSDRIAELIERIAEAQAERDAQYRERLERLAAEQAQARIEAEQAQRAHFEQIGTQIAGSISSLEKRLERLEKSQEGHASNLDSLADELRDIRDQVGQLAEGQLVLSNGVAEKLNAVSSQLGQISADGKAMSEAVAEIPAVKAAIAESAEGVEKSISEAKGQIIKVQGEAAKFIAGKVDKAQERLQSTVKDLNQIAIRLKGEAEGMFERISAAKDVVRSISDLYRSQEQILSQGLENVLLGAEAHMTSRVGTLVDRMAVALHASDTFQELRGVTEAVNRFEAGIRVVGEVFGELKQYERNITSDAHEFQEKFLANIRNASGEVTSQYAQVLETQKSIIALESRVKGAQSLLENTIDEINKLVGSVRHITDLVDNVTMRMGKEFVETGKEIFEEYVDDIKTNQATMLAAFKGEILSDLLGQGE